MVVLTPRLAALDEKVLAALDDGPVRAGTVAALLFGERRWHCERCGRDTLCDVVSHGRRHARGEAIGCLDCMKRSGWTSCDKTMRPVLIASPQDTRTVREVLRGLERIGLARQAGGWWRRAA